MMTVVLPLLVQAVTMLKVPQHQVLQMAQQSKDLRDPLL
jgi:hypothetical protein